MVTIIIVFISCFIIFGVLFVISEIQINKMRKRYEKEYELINQQVDAKIAKALKP